MENPTNQKAVNRWLNVPIIALITRLLCRELTLENEYLRLENKILKSKIHKRIIFTDDECRTLVEVAMALGRELMERVVKIVVCRMARENSGLPENLKSWRSSSVKAALQIF
jgi:hypothetical protein